MQQYVMLFFETAEQMAHRGGPDAPAYWAAWRSYIDTIAQSGIMRGGNGLELPATATTLRMKDGKPHVQDGPFADVKERLGGYVIVEVEDIDAALKWAARSPAANGGAVEVRPVLPPPA